MEIYIEVRHTVFTLDTDKLDRNYEDEDYAYWIVEDENGYIHVYYTDYVFSGMQYRYYETFRIWLIVFSAVLMFLSIISFQSLL